MSEPSEERHPSLYFPDGDIALSARTAAGITQVFRVDRILLSRHSEVFRDMLAVSSDKTSSAETYDGVPLVVMPVDDTAEDVQCLLDVMYNIGGLHRILSSPSRGDTPTATAGLMKMAAKYIVKDIEALVIQHIESEWPTTLKDWDKRSLELYETETPSSPLHSHPEPVSAIQFAWAHGVQENILCAAFYQLSITPVDVTPPSSPLSPGALTARWALLDARHALILMQGKSDMAKYAWQQINPIFSKFGAARSTSIGPLYGMAGRRGIPPCSCAADAFAKIYESHLKPWLEKSVLDFLQELRLLGTRTENGQLEVCQTCKTRITRELAMLRYRIWDQVPTFFPFST